MPELQRLAEGLEAAGYSVVLWDKRGHGDSEGRFSFGRYEWKDLVRLTEILKEEAPKAPLYALGFSFGAFHSVLAAASGAPYDGLVLVAGPQNFRGLHKAIFSGHVFRTLKYRAQRPLRLPRLGWPWQARLFPREEIKKVRAPTLIIHGTDDWIVPAAHSRALFASAVAPTELKILDGGLHAEYLLAKEPERFFDTLLPWLAARRSEQEARPK